VVSLVERFDPDELRKIVEETRRCRIDREAIKEYARITGDSQPIHQDLEAARKAGFEDIPIMGTHLMAIGFKIAQETFHHLVDFGRISARDYSCVSLSGKIKKPAYPGRMPDWKIECCDSEEGRTAIKVVGRLEEAISVETAVVFGKRNPEMEMPSRVEAGPIAAPAELTIPSLRMYQNLLNKEKGNDFDEGLGASYPAGAFVRMLRATGNGDIAAINRSSTTEFYHDLEAGHTDILIYVLKETWRNSSWIYDLQGRLMQNGRCALINTGRAMTAEKLNLEKMREISDIDHIVL
jgi:acyl dehydratase